MRKELHTILNYGEHPVRIGEIEGIEVFALQDLLRALGVPHINVTNITVRLPPDVYYRATSIDKAGLPTNARVSAVTLEGAYLTLSRLSRVDLLDVLLLTRWMKTIKRGKMKKAAP